MEAASPLTERLTELVKISGNPNRFAGLVDVSHPTVVGWIGGTEPYPKTLEKIAAKTGVSLAWLRDGQGDEEAELEVFRRRMASVATGTPREKLAAVLKAHGLNPSQLAKIIRYDAGIIENVVNGAARASEKMIDAICREFPELGKAELMEGSETPRILEESGVLGTHGATPHVRMPGKGTTRYVPLLSWAAAGSVASAAALDEAFEGEAVASTVPGRAFAVEISGDSMHPEINPGDYAVVRADVQARPGQVVLVRTIHGDVLCKRFSTRDSEKLVILSSVNKSYEPIEIPASEIAWIYPVKQVIRNY